MEEIWKYNEVPEMIKAYLFDFDGTLVDSMPNFASCMLRILDENQIPYESDIVKVITPLGLQGTAEHYQKMGLNKPLDEIMMIIKEYLLDGYLYHIPAKPHVIEVLREMKANGAKLNILTASPHVNLDACLNRLGIFDLFDNVWSCDDFNTTKADPEIYKRAAEKIGEPVDQVLFLDDNLNADMTAKKAGMLVCGVYDPSSDDYVDAMKAANDYYIYDFSELQNLR